MNSSDCENQRSPRVFISYSHDSESHCDRVLALAQQLRRDGINAEIDQFHSETVQHWPRWCAEQLRPENSDFVLCICSEEYRHRIDGQVDADVGRGVFWEGTIIYNQIYRAKGSHRFIPVLFADNESVIPDALVNFTWFKLEAFDLAAERSPYAKLYRLLTGQPSVEKAELGELHKLPRLPAEERRTDFMLLHETVQRLESKTNQIGANTDAILSILRQTETSIASRAQKPPPPPFPLWLVGLFGRDVSPIGRAPASADPELHRLINSRGDDWSKTLQRYLNDVDAEFNWQPARYTELEAEVEEYGPAGAVRRISKLQTALRWNNQQPVVLVLGDPGSGKSVALRKLVLDLLLQREWLKTGRIPLYFNLRDWTTPASWTDATVPKSEEVAEQLTSWMCQRCAEIFGGSEHPLPARFREFLNQGRLYIVLDSFDEIPAALDAHEGGPLLEALSDGIYRLLSGEEGSGRRGILASRFFRRPAGRKYQAYTLELRPFSDRRLLQFFRKHLPQLPSFGELLIRDHPQLAAACRNPFTAALLVEYHNRSRERDKLFPETRQEIYSAAVTHRLGKLVENLPHLAAKTGNLLPPATIPELRAGLALIAQSVFATGGGFDLDFRTAQLIWPRLSESLLVAAFCQSGLLRLGQNAAFLGFAHRRLAEYLAAGTLPAEVNRLPLNHIPTANGRWRDCLIVWAETAPLAAATKLANWCWSQATSTASPEERPAGDDLPGFILDLPERDNILQFLLDAFATRIQAVEQIQGLLTQFVTSAVENSNVDLLTAKRAAEVAGLIQGAGLNSFLQSVIARNNQWITETAFRACRFQSTPVPTMRDLICRQINQLSLKEIWASRDFMFSLRLSAGLRFAYQQFVLRRLDHVLLVAVPLGLALGGLFADSIVYYCGLVLWAGSMLATAICWENANLWLQTNRVRIWCVWASPFLALLGGFGIQSEAVWRPWLAGCSIQLLFCIWVPFLPSLLLSSNLGYRETVTLDSAGTFFIAMGRMGLRRAGELVNHASKQAPTALAVILGALALPFVEKLIQRIFPLLVQLGTALDKLTEMFRILVGLVVLIVLGLVAVKWCRQRLAAIYNQFFDRKRLSEIQLALSPLMQRPLILETLQSFRTCNGRLAFLRCLRKRGIEAEGQWPGGTLPAKGNSRDEIELAKLEEEWLAEQRRRDYEKEIAIRSIERIHPTDQV